MPEPERSVLRAIIFLYHRIDPLSHDQVSDSDCYAGVSAYNNQCMAQIAIQKILCPALLREGGEGDTSNLEVELVHLMLIDARSNPTFWDPSFGQCVSCFIPAVWYLT